MTSTSRLVYDERLTAPRTWWVIAALVAPAIGTCLAGMYVIPTPVRVEVLDPDDPTPYLYLATRTPESPAKALGTRS
ncbi:DUF3093 family protein [Streptomyces sp. NPDC051954]|uniref:DUF3093 family protein n=1 Tax=Streptomyces sp. NPDC051954 TaxID=3155524 RepID=UPI003412493E